MSTNYLSPNMSLVIPVPTQEPGPNWAFDLNSSLTILDSHNHSPGSGVQVPSSGININADLTWNNAYNAVALRSVRFFPNAAALSAGSDLGCLYEAGVDLYYNDGNGNQVRITQSGSVAGASGTITGLPSGTASAAFSGVSGTFTFQQATSTAANMDVGTVIVRYPGSYPTPSGNYIAIEAPTSLASGYALTLPSLPGQTNVMTLGSAGAISSVTWDAVGTNMTSVGADAIIASSTLDRSSGTGGPGQVVYSSNTGSFTTNNNSPTSTGAAVTITTSGRPVMLVFQAPQNGTISFITCSNNAGVIALQKTGGSANSFSVGSTTTSFSMVAVDYSIAGAAGTYTYTADGYVVGSGTLNVRNYELIAYELT